MLSTHGGRNRGSRWPPCNPRPGMAPRTRRAAIQSAANSSPDELSIFRISSLKAFGAPPTGTSGWAACNTAAGDNPGEAALSTVALPPSMRRAGVSGLALVARFRGGRLTTSTFAVLKSDPQLDRVAASTSSLAPRTSQWPVGQLVATPHQTAADAMSEEFAQEWDVFSVRRRYLALHARPIRRSDSAAPASS